MRKYKGFTLIEAMVLLLVASLMILAMFPVLTSKKVNVAVNSNVTQCVTKENAANLISSACLASVNGGKSNSQNYLDSIIMYLEGDNSAYSAAALKILGSVCDAGGTTACDKIIDRCAKDSTKCDIENSNYDLNYYLKLTSTDANSGRSYIESVLPSYFNFGLDNIVSLVNSACCSDNALNSACTVKSKKMCPQKVGFDTPLYYDYAYGSTMDSNGNIYLVGATTTSPGADDPRDINIVKLNSSLGLEWQKKLGNSTNNEKGYGIAVDNNSNVYITGKSYSTATGNDVIAAKLDGNNGNFIWKKTYNTSVSGDEEGNGLALSADGSTLFITGYTSVSGNNDVLLMSINTSSGNISSAYRYAVSTGSDTAYDIQADETGTIYLVGRGKSSKDILMMKLDSTLDSEYITHNLSTSDDMGFGLSIGADNTIYLTGYAFSGGSPNYRNLVVMAINPSTLTKKWEKLFKASSTEQAIGNRIMPDAYGNIIVAGYIEPRTSTNDCDYYEHAYALKLSGKNGNIIWQKSVYPAGSRDSEVHGIFFPDKYSIMLTGGYLPENGNCPAVDGDGHPVYDAAHNYKIMTLKMDTVQTSDSLFTQESLSMTTSGITSLSKTAVTFAAPTSIPDSSVIDLNMTTTTPSINFN